MISSSLLSLALPGDLVVKLVPKVSFIEQGVGTVSANAEEDVVI